MVLPLTDPAVADIVLVPVISGYTNPVPLPSFVIPVTFGLEEFHTTDLRVCVLLSV